MTWFERLWKYAGIGASSIIGEETNPILGGIAVRHGRLDLVAVIVSIAVGTWIASIILYYIGYSRIGWVRATFPNKKRLIEAALAIVARHPWRSALAVRFAYGLRLPLPIACGAARMPIGLYTVASGISSWVWSIGFTYLGLAFAGLALRLLEFTEKPEIRLGVIALVLFVLLIIITTRRRASEREDAKASVREPDAS